MAGKSSENSVVIHFFYIVLFSHCLDTSQHKCTHVFVVDSISTQNLCSLLLYDEICDQIQKHCRLKEIKISELSVNLAVVRVYDGEILQFSQRDFSTSKRPRGRVEHKHERRETKPNTKHYKKNFTTT